MENRDFRLSKILKELNISFIEAAFVLKNNLNLGIFSNSISQRITEEQLNALVEYKKERNEPPSANGFKIIINQQTGLCELSVNTSKFIYGNGFISFNYNGECYNCPIKSISPKLNQYKDGIYRNFHTVNVRIINKKKRGCRQFYFTKKYFSNYRKRTLDDCKKIPRKNVYKDASYKSIYIDYLASNQSNKQLIKAYEVFNGIEEDCFIFTIKMKDDLSAIVFENVLFARASEVFVVHEQEYEKSVNLIFNYFTDYELKQKRLAIKRKLIKAENFNAIKYVSIDHDKFPTWINKIQDVISSVKIQQGNIQFVHGLRISKDVSLRSSHKATTNISHIHKDLMLKLFSNWRENTEKKMLEQKFVLVKSVLIWR